MTGALDGIRVLDLSRVLAGPWCTQILGDLGAEVIKVEQPGQGDDTRQWGPPFIDDGSGDSAYFTCANRNKQSIAVDIATPEGADIIRGLASKADIVVENFRVGGLAKYGLDYQSLSATRPDLIWCSITGFGQDGPDSARGGYDFLVQAMSGLMSVTGLPDSAPGGGPLKVGIPISDLTTGLYAAISILAALHHRDATGQGQQIDLALLDTQVSLMTNQAANWLNGGKEPRRLGNQHPNMVPYQVFPCADGDIIIATANDRQFGSLCKVLGLIELIDDARFAEVSARNLNRDPLIEMLEGRTRERQAEALITELGIVKVPCGRISTVPQALSCQQVEARGLVRDIRRPNGANVRFVGYPGKLSRTPASYRSAPPRSGEDTRRILQTHLDLTDQQIDRLREAGTIAEKV